MLVCGSRRRRDIRLHPFNSNTPLPPFLFLPPPPLLLLSNPARRNGGEYKLLLLKMFVCEELSSGAAAHPLQRFQPQPELSFHVCRPSTIPAFCIHRSINIHVFSRCFPQARSTIKKQRHKLFFFLCILLIQLLVNY